jgi:hypothetical protein
MEPGGMAELILIMVANVNLNIKSGKAHALARLLVLRLFGQPKGEAAGPSRFAANGGAAAL